MSPDSYQLFNTWFPAIVVGIVITLLGGAIWDLLRRRTWCFASRFWPGILEEVGLDTSSLSRAEVENKQREIIEAISNLSPQITKAFLPAKSSMAETINSTLAKSSNYDSFVSSKLDASGDFDLEAQTGINPVYTPGSSNSLTFTATAYFPDDTPMFVIRPTKKLFNRYSKRTVKKWKSSIVLQASLPIDPCVLAEIGDLAKHCMQMDYRCTFQLDNWAILYCNVGEVHLHLLQEGDVPVNAEARWQADGTSITMRGLYLNGAQVKAATKRTNTILRSVGPATQGPGELDELHFPIEERDVPGEDSLIFAAKIVEADGVSLTVRSEASFILPPRQKFSFIEALWGQLEWISISARKLMKSFHTAEDRQESTTAANRPQMRLDMEHSLLILEHWKGVSEIELLENRKKVLHFLHDRRQFRIANGFSSQPREKHLHFIRDVEYWQRGLHDVNEVILQRLTGRLQSGTHISIRGGMKFLCGDFESALQDLDLAYQIMQEHPTTVLVERALVKCMLARYSEALEDVGAVIAINPNENCIQELQSCIQQILDQRTPIRRIQDGPSFERPRLSDQDNLMVTILPDLLTGDEWHSGESESPRTMSDDITDGESTDLAQPRDVTMAFEVDPLQRELQLKLTNYAESLESKPRYHVRRISFIANILRDEFTNQCKPLSAEDQKMLNWQTGTETLQDDSEVRNDLTNLSERLCPSKNILLSRMYDSVTDHGTFHQRRREEPLQSAYRHISFRSATLTKHSSPNGEAQLLFLHDGLPEDLSFLRWHPHDYMGFSGVSLSYRVFWLVQWDVVDLLEPISDDQIDTTIGGGAIINSRRSCLDHPGDLHRQGDSTGMFHGIFRSEKSKSLGWLAEVRPEGLKGWDKKIWLGTYETAEAAAPAADQAGFHYYNLQNRFNFRDSPLFPREIQKKHLSDDVIQQPCCSCDEESQRCGMPDQNQSLFGFDRCNNTTSNSDGHVHGSSTRRVQEFRWPRARVIFPRQFNAFLDKKSLRQCRCKDCPSRFDYQHHQTSSWRDSHRASSAYQPPENSSDVARDVINSAPGKQKKSCSSDGSPTRIECNLVSQYRLKDTSSPKSSTTLSSVMQEHQVACDPSQAEAGLHNDWRQVSNTPSLDLASNYSRKLPCMNTEREPELRCLAERDSELRPVCCKRESENMDD